MICVSPNLPDTEFAYSNYIHAVTSDNSPKINIQLLENKKMLINFVEKQKTSFFSSKFFNCPTKVCFFNS